MIDIKDTFEIFCRKIGGNLEVFDKDFPTGLEKTYRCHAKLDNSNLTIEITPSNGELVVRESKGGKVHALQTRLVYDSTCHIDEVENYVKFVCSSPEEPEDTIVIGVEGNTLRRLKIYGTTGTITYKMIQL